MANKNFNFGKFNNIKTALVKKNPELGKPENARKLAIIAKSMMKADEKKAGTDTAVTELKLFAATEKKLVDAGLDTINKVNAAKDEVLVEAGLSEKAVLKVREMIKNFGAKKAEAPVKETKAEEPVKSDLDSLNLFDSTKAKLINAGINTIEGLKKASEKALTEAGLSEKAVAAVKKLVA